MKTITYEHSSAQDRIAQTITESLKQFDRDIKSERIKKGIAAKKLNKK